MELPQQLLIVHKVAATYWGQDENDIQEALDGIAVIKRNGGKIAGYFPEFAGFPAVFYKVYFYPRGFEFESQGLQAANRMPQVEGIRVPKIIRIMPEYQALILEKRAWLDTDSELKRFFLQSMGFDWEKIGRWLRAFHDTQVSRERNDYFLRKKFEKIEAHLEKLQVLFSDQELQKINAVIQAARDYFEAQTHEWVISHGDFLLGNIKMTDHVMDIIDFEDSQVAPFEFDILNFLTRLEYAGYFPHLPGTYQKIRDEFLAGYGKPIDFTSPVHDFFYLFIKLDAIETYYRRRHNMNCPLYQKGIYYLFERAGLKRLKSWYEYKILK